MSELPPPEYRAGCYIDGAVMPEDAFTDVQMRTYALAARRAALEEAARACEGVAAEWDAAGNYQRNDYEAVPQDGCDECASAIRALADNPLPEACAGSAPR